jgi:ADP-heptose:LPS heptosyltransferase
MDWVTQPEYVELAGCIEGVRRVIPFPRRGFFRGLSAFRAELRTHSYDLAVDLQGLLKSAVAARLSGAPRRIAPSFSREGAGWLATETAKGTHHRHAVERCLDSARHLGAPVDMVRFPFRFPEPPAGTFSVDGKSRLVIAPCSRWPAKNWPVERFAAVAAHAARMHGADLFVIGGPADRPAAEAIQSAAGVPVRILCGDFSLPGLGGFFRHCDLLLTNDSGPMHLAAAGGTRVLGLFGPTDPHRTGPWGERHVLLRPEAAKRNPGDYKDSANRVIDGISVGEVTRALDDHLAPGPHRAGQDSGHV